MLNFPEFAELVNGTWRIVLVLGIFIITFLIVRITRYIIHRFFEKKSKKIKVDPTQFNFLKHTVSAVIYLIGVGIAIYMIPKLRSLSYSLLAGAGILAVIIGFASQQAFSNVISGIFIVIFKPFRVGDRIKIGTDYFGIIEDITLRHTVIRNWQNVRVIIPNSKIAESTIENMDISDPKVCKWIEFGISYDSDINKAMKIMRQEAEKHEFCIDNRDAEAKKKKEPKVNVRVIGFGDSSVNLRAWVWANNSGEGFVMSCDLNKSIKERFDKEGVEIPFPYRTLVYKKDITKKTRKRR